jgi:hypothetical protein
VDTLKDSGSYFYRVKAKKDNLYSAYSNEVVYNLTEVLPTQGLVAYYPFNGNANDESGHGNNGTVNGATLTTDRFGKVNKAYSFDGSQYISVSDANNLDLTNNFTISVWINVNTFVYLGGIVSKYQSNAAYGYTLRLSKNSPYKKINFSEFEGVNFLSASFWYHIVGMVKNGAAMIYVNGSLDASGIPGTLQANSDPLRIGEDFQANARYFKGKIDDIRIYNRALTDQEIQVLYHEGGW